MTHAVLETIAAFLNTEGGDLPIGVGDRAGTCIDPKGQVVQGKTVRVMSCQRRPGPVFLKWKGLDDSGSDAAARQRR